MWVVRTSFLHSSYTHTPTFPKVAYFNYSEGKVADAYAKWRAAQKGTLLHAFAAQCIILGQKLPRSDKTLNMYVNDAIGYKMTPEQVLYYSPNCFGTADTISFRNNFLRMGALLLFLTVRLTIV